MAISTAPQMPMGQSAKLPLSAADLLPADAFKSAPSSTPPAASGLMAGPGGTPIGSMPSPEMPSEPPFEVVLQADGSSIYQTKTNPPVVIGVNKPPKLPAAMAQKAQAEMGGSL